MNPPRILFSLRALAAVAIAAFLSTKPVLAQTPEVFLPGGISLSSIYSFTNAVLPAASLVQGTNGNFYGTTEQIGTNLSGGIFMLAQSGDLTNLVVFDGANGAVPEGPLFLSTDGNFYGTTAQGGNGNRGTIFRMTHAGVLTTLAKFPAPTGPILSAAWCWGRMAIITAPPRPEARADMEPSLRGARELV